MDGHDAAFPVIGGNSLYAKGMDLRTYIATAAMQGCLAGDRWVNNPSLLAHHSVACADALLAELAKKPESEAP